MKNNLKVLVVEDEAITQRSIIKTLIAEGFEAKGVMSGEEALIEVNSFYPDVVLMDIRISGVIKNGIDVVKMLNASKHPMAIAFMTAFFRDEYSNVQGIHYHNWINKPLNYDALAIDVQEAYQNFKKEQLSKEETIENLGKNTIPVFLIERESDSLEERFSVVPCNEGKVYIKTSDILFLKRARGKGVKQTRIFMLDGSVYRVSRNLSYFMNSLGKEFLIQINQGVVINAKWKNDIKYELGNDYIEMLGMGSKNKFSRYYSLSPYFKDFELDNFTFKVTRTYKEKGVLDLINSFD